MKKIIFAIVLIFILAGLAISLEQEPQMGKTDFGISLATDKATYTAGTPIVAELRVFNRTARAVTFQFSTAQRYDFIIENSRGEELWRWSKERMFAQMLGEETVEPGQELIYTERCESHLDPGTYKLSALLKATDRPFSASLTIVIE